MLMTRRLLLFTACHSCRDVCVQTSPRLREGINKKIACFRSRHFRLPAATLQETEENKDCLQPESVAETGARVREESLRRGRGKEAIGTGVIVNGDTGGFERERERKEDVFIGVLGFSPLKS